MGATHVINAREIDVVKRVWELTGHGADVCIEAAGAQTTLNQAISCTRKHGIIQIVAMFHGPLVIENQVEYMSKELTLRMSSAAYCNRFDTLLRLISEEKLTPQMLISKEITLEHLVDEGIIPLLSDKTLFKVLVKCG